MRILFVHQHFAPETVGTSTRAVEITHHLASRGHDVVVVTGIPSHPSTMAAGGVARKLPRYENHHGVNVHRVWTFGSRARDTFWRRMAAYASFMILGGFKALTMPGKFDAVVAISPLPNGIAAYVTSFVRCIPFMFDVCDIWPDCAVAVGMLENRTLIRLAEWAEKRIYGHAKRIGVVTRGFTTNLVRKSVPREKIALLPDWVDPAVYDSATAPREVVRRELHLAGKFVVSFLGNFGLLMGIEQILETARLLKNDPDVRFLFIGKGVEQGMMERRCAEWDLANVRIIPYQPRDRVPGLLAASDALIVTYRNTEITRITVPSKIYEYMASARPIVAGVEGVIADILRDAQCGLISEQRNPAEMAKAIGELKNDAELRARMGAHGRDFAIGHFTFARVSADYEVAIAEAALAGVRVNRELSG